MGYYTFFTFKVYDKNGNSKTDIIKDIIDIEDIIENEDCNSKIYRVMNFLKKKTDFCYGLTSEESAKWYDHEIDMKKLSKKFPDLVFCVHGDGEENGDIWREYYYNGKVSKRQKPEIKWSNFEIKEWCNG